MPTNRPTTGSTKVDGGLAALLTASVAGVYLADDPIAFVQAVIAKWIIGGFLSLVGYVSQRLYVHVWLTFTGALTDAGGAVAGAFGGAGDALLDAVIGGIGGVVVDVASSAGPFAPLVAIVLFAALALLVVGLIRGLWELYLLIRSAVV